MKKIAQNSFLLAFVITFALSHSNGINIDWKKVKPITQHPQFWDNKPIDLRPQNEYIDAQRNGTQRIVGLDSRNAK